jgi:hypothetical protein
MWLNFRNMEKMAFLLLVLIVGLLTRSELAVIAVTVVGLLVHWTDRRKHEEVRAEVADEFTQFVAERRRERVSLPKTYEENLLYLDFSETHAETPQEER